MKFIRILAFPLSLLYGAIVAFRNKLYDWKVLTSKQFDLPVISVGNLCVGGTGKTPHIEYLIRLLKSEFYIAALSRGYGRKSSGFILADTQSTAADIGDEPLQFKRKFNNVRVAVDAKRVHGIKELLKNYPSLQCILLDDAFQHRAVMPGLSIVLTDYSKLYVNDLIVPSGTLREFKSGISRAEIIIVTKCPTILLPIERKRLISELKPLPHQKVYFSYIKYGDFQPISSDMKNPFPKEFYFERNYSILLLTGIANTSSLEYYLKDKVKNVERAKYADHHSYTVNDINAIKKIFNNIAPANKIILTTEKDAMRLKSPQFSDALKDLPVFYMPIEIDFHDKDKELFNEQIIHYVRTNQKNSSLHSK
ncbi:MAG: tetraacyldisaccharide 4-kinase [Bacteroidetes bacterium]|nr:tetraacyldisaccharide 4-kinase [Bacteroidota bacterium]